MEETGGPMAMPVFAGQKLVVAGGSSGMGRQTAAESYRDAYQVRGSRTGRQEVDDLHRTIRGDPVRLEHQSVADVPAARALLRGRRGEGPSPR